MTVTRRKIHPWISVFHTDTDKLIAVLYLGVVDADVFRGCLHVELVGRQRLDKAIREDCRTVILEIVYDILWDLACVDGIVSPEERGILRQITSSLRISESLFDWQCRHHGVSDDDTTSSGPADPYEIMGCTRGASDEDVKSAYREKAKQLHPDVLRAQGLSEELIAKANDQMARVNAAWAEIRRERGI